MSAGKARERGIIFTDTVPALLAGTKTQTRRIAKGRHPIGFLGGSDQVDDPACWGWFFDGPEQHGYAVLARGLNERWDNGRVSIPCPYGEPGDRLWVRETWCQASWDAVSDEDPQAIDGRPRGPAHRPDPESDTILRPFAFYRATDRHVVSTIDETRSPWKSPIHMPRWASRVTLELTDVRMQRVQDISEEDARAEGVDVLDGLLDEAEICRLAKLAGCMATDNRAWFAAAWEMIHGRGAWKRNDWVWALSFRRVEPAR